MKLLIALLFSVNAMAAFIPIAPAPINYYGTPLMAKGELVTSDGISNGSFPACADDEILVWDAAELAGMKCEAKPSGGVSSYNQTFLINNQNVGGVWTFAATTTSSHVLVVLQGDADSGGNWTCNGAGNASQWFLRRNGVNVASARFVDGSAQTGNMTLLDAFVGTATYSVHNTALTGTMYKCKLTLIAL